MSLLGLIGIVVSIVAGYKTGNTDFYIVGGLIWIGVCIIELPRTMFHRFKQIIDSLQKILNTKKD